MADNFADVLDLDEFVVQSLPLGLRRIYTTRISSAETERRISIVNHKYFSASALQLGLYKPISKILP